MIFDMIRHQRLLLQMKQFVTTGCRGSPRAKRLRQRACQRPKQKKQTARSPLPSQRLRQRPRPRPRGPRPLVGRPRPRLRPLRRPRPRPRSCPRQGPRERLRPETWPRSRQGAHQDRSPLTSSPHASSPHSRAVWIHHPLSALRTYHSHAAALTVRILKMIS